MAGRPRPPYKCSDGRQHNKISAGPTDACPLLCRGLSQERLKTASFVAGRGALHVRMSNLRTCVLEQTASDKHPPDLEMVFAVAAVLNTVSDHPWPWVLYKSPMCVHSHERSTARAPHN